MFEQRELPARCMVVCTCVLVAIVEQKYNDLLVHTVVFRLYIKIGNWLTHAQEYLLMLSSIRVPFKTENKLAGYLFLV